ncbi:response regulator [Dendrosporobacter sp. 1207_IL3150]|uniref:response regulator n=1 Tax=Dendrosporobacter sp. 1207_IL3150 TaxID=3084054 RepID=UPI002FDB6F0A
MRIRTKLYYGLGIILTIIVAISLFFIQMFNELNENTIQIVNHRYEKVRLISSFRYELNNWSRELRGLPVNTNPQLMAENIKIAQSYKMNAYVALDALDRFTTDEESRKAVTKIRTVLSNYEKIGEAIVSSVDSGVSYSQVRPALFEGAQVRSDIISELDKLQNAEEIAIKNELNKSQEIHNTAVRIIYMCVIAGVLLAIGVTYWIVEAVTRNLNKVTSVINTAVSGSMEYMPRIHITAKDEIGEIATAFNKMADELDNHAELEQEQSWLNYQVAEIVKMCQTATDFDSLAKLFLQNITPVVGASYGVFYLTEEINGEKYLVNICSFASDNLDTQLIKYGEGLVGQCAVNKEPIMVKNIPEDYIKITSGLGKANPQMIMILPIEFENEILGVVELASFGSFGRIEQKLLTEAANFAGVTLSIINSRMRVENLLKESQIQAEELQEQSEELRTQQEELNAQQQELIAINEQLEEQYSQAEIKSRELEKAKTALEEHAKQLSQSSKYKSEFLANMSHELRTPLNSLLILAQVLTENKDGNLSQKQIEYANTIQSSGYDLLNLINDILDLSKIESGRMELNLTEVKVEELCEDIGNSFKIIARRKGLEFITDINTDTPTLIYTDEHRLKQVLKNLLSNALKFTESGSIRLEFKPTSIDLLPSVKGERNIENVVAISVIDTGIGIASDKQDIIFKAFRQADGTTSRKYGGTGLGLTISRDIAKLIGGFIDVKSSLGQGSNFTLYIPNYAKETHVAVVHEAAASLTETSSIEFDDFYTQQEVLEGKKVLIIDDDMRNLFALTTALENQKMEVLVSENGQEGIEILKVQPHIDIILMDVMMPEMDGYTAIQIIRDIPKFKDIPIIALTAKAMKNDREYCLQAGASDYISKPINLEQLLSLMRVWLYR